MKAQGVFRKCGENVMIISRKIPLYSRLISIGNNVWIASGVSFLTHDVVHFMLNCRRSQNEPRFEEKVGCIEIADNVFIGANTTILYDVKIGNNVVVGSNTLVNKDIPDNRVCYLQSSILQAYLIPHMLDLTARNPDRNVHD